MKTVGNRIGQVVCLVGTGTDLLFDAAGQGRGDRSRFGIVCTIGRKRSDGVSGSGRKSIHILCRCGIHRARRNLRVPLQDLVFQPSIGRTVGCSDCFQVGRNIRQCAQHRITAACRERI